MKKQVLLASMAGLIAAAPLALADDHKHYKQGLEDLPLAESSFVQTENGVIMASYDEPDHSFQCKITFTGTCDRPFENVAEVFKVCEDANIHKIEKHKANYLWVQIPPQIYGGDYDPDRNFDVGAISIHYFRCANLPKANQQITETPE